MNSDRNSRKALPMRRTATNTRPVHGRCGSRPCPHAVTPTPSERRAPSSPPADRRVLEKRAGDSAAAGPAALPEHRAAECEG